MAEKLDPAKAHKLEDPERLVHLPPGNIVRLLKFSGAETVIDFGAGTGLYTLPIAEALPAGRVIAVDEQNALLERLREKLAAHVASARINHARMDRPTGPPNDHVLSIEEARAVLAGTGLDELMVHHPGEVGRYSFAIVARKPAP